MKLNIPKSTLLLLLAALGSSSTTQITYANATQEIMAGGCVITITPEQQAQLHKIHQDIHQIKEIALYLIGSLEGQTVRYKLDEIIIRMESTEPLMVNLLEQLQDAINQEEVSKKNANSYLTALKIKHEVVAEVHTILKQLATILRDGLIKAVPAGKQHPVSLKFLNQVKDPIKRLSAPSELNRLAAKLTALHSVIEELNSENADTIKELLELLNKLKKLTEGGSNSIGYTDIGKRLPKGAPFSGLPQNLKLADWLHEMQK